MRAADAPETAVATRGYSLMKAKGCFACHSTDGPPVAAPALRRGMIGWTRPVVVEGNPRDVVVDEAYFARALREPDREVAIGFRAGVMPKYDVSDDDVHAMVEAIQHPDAVDADAVRRGGSMFPLVGCAAAFVFFHFFLSATPVRRQWQLAIGAKGFSAVYSILSLATFVGMIVFYRTAPLVELWTPPRWTRWIPVLLMPTALLFLVAGFSTPSPTSVGQEATAKEARPIGIQAVTRHPALWGFALWAIGHLAANGELHVIVVAGAILVLALGGMLHIDARRKAALGKDWDAYAAKTSRVPFVAIARGRAKLVFAEIGARRLVIAAILYVVIFFAHPYVIGASPSP